MSSAALGGVLGVSSAEEGLSWQCTTTSGRKAFRRLASLATPEEYPVAGAVGGLLDLQVLGGGVQPLLLTW